MRVTQIIIGLSIISLLGCNDSQLGAASENEGPPGASGLTSLIKTEAELAGENCPNGGTKLMTGLDDDQSGELDEGEVDSVAYVCNGEAGPAGGAEGATGPQGEPGPQGDAGPPGDAGADGYSSLALSQDEAPGENCPNGGVYLQTGLDINGDGILGTTEVNSVNFICNGLNGDTNSPALGVSEAITVRRRSKQFRYSSVSEFQETFAGLETQLENDAAIGSIEHSPVGMSLSEITDLLSADCPTGYFATSAKCAGRLTYQPSTGGTIYLALSESHYALTYDDTQHDWDSQDAILAHDGGDDLEGSNGAVISMVQTSMTGLPRGAQCIPLERHYGQGTGFFYSVIKVPGPIFSGVYDGDLFGFDLDIRVTCLMKPD